MPGLFARQTIASPCTFVYCRRRSLRSISSMCVLENDNIGYFCYTWNDHGFNHLSIIIYWGWGWVGHSSYPTVNFNFLIFNVYAFTKIHKECIKKKVLWRCLDSPLSERIETKQRMLSVAGQVSQRPRRWRSERYRDEHTLASSPGSKSRSGIFSFMGIVLDHGFERVYVDGGYIFMDRFRCSHPS